MFLVSTLILVQEPAKESGPEKVKGGKKAVKKHYKPKGKTS